MWIIKDNHGNILQHDDWSTSKKFLLLARDVYKIIVFATEKAALSEIEAIVRYTSAYYSVPARGSAWTLHKLIEVEWE